MYLIIIYKEDYQWCESPEEKRLAISVLAYSLDHSFGPG